MLVGAIIIIVLVGMFASEVSDLIWKIRLIGYALRRK